MTIGLTPDAVHASGRRIVPAAGGLQFVRNEFDTCCENAEDGSGEFGSVIAGYQEFHDDYVRSLQQVQDHGTDPAGSTVAVTATVY